MSTNALRVPNDKQRNCEKPKATIRIAAAMQLLIACVMFLSNPTAFAQPPTDGTVWLDRDIIKPTDPTAFERLENAGRGNRLMFDRRIDDWVRVNAFLFDAYYDDGLMIEIQVNPEFRTENRARSEAVRYAPVIGRLPTVLRKGVETVWIHRGDAVFGGGNNNILIHTERAARVRNDGFLEEVFIHEASHSSLDARHARAFGWRQAQRSDPEFFSTYARDNPNREDIAESFLLYFAVRFRSDRISQDLFNLIHETIPNRLAYFDNLDLDMYPVVLNAGVSITSYGFNSERGEVTLSWQSRANRQYAVEGSSDLSEWSQLGDVFDSTGEVSEATRSFQPGTDQLFIRVRTLP